MWSFVNQYINMSKYSRNYLIVLSLYSAQKKVISPEETES